MTKNVIKILLLNHLIKAESLHFHQILLKIHCGDVATVTKIMSVSKSSRVPMHTEANYKGGFYIMSL